MNKTYKILEYGSFVRDKNVPGCVSLPKSTFDSLENFILSNRSKSVDALELLRLGARKGVGKVIGAKNYVGVITMDDGTTIEILPKVYSSEKFSEAQVKKLLVSMIQTLKNTPFKCLQRANLDTEKMDIFEIFITMFIEEVFYIVKRGLKSSYERVASNENAFKGKLLFKDHIKANLAHKERCFVEHDQFNVNCAENKILKATLLYLYKYSKSSKNRNDIRTLLNSFANISPSTDYEGDFSKIVSDRNNANYHKALMWSKIFLKGKSFTAFAGSNVAFALLFPMEKLFERYIEVQLRKVLDKSRYTLSAQDSIYHLFSEPKKSFLMKPDLVIRDKVENNVYVLDTKWKILSSKKSNYDINQGDMYQMYAYQKKYNAKNITLIYPNSDPLITSKNIEYNSGDGVTIKVKFVDLFNINKSLKELLDDVL